MFVICYIICNMLFIDYMMSDRLISYVVYDVSHVTSCMLHTFGICVYMHICIYICILCIYDILSYVIHPSQFVMAG